MRTMQWIGIVTLLLCAPAMSQAPATAPAEPAATGDGGQAAPGARRRGPDISQWDKDGDGKLSDEERKKMYEEIGKQVREAFQQRAGRGAAAQPADKP